MVPEAKLESTEHGVVPQGEGWFVVNVREARWYGNAELGRFCPFEGDARFPELGINIGVVEPGQPSCMYHGESSQEDFLVLAGECLLLVEGEERRLGPWDFVHCPPWTEHVFVGAGSGPCAILAVGARRAGSEVRYPVAEIALRHGAGVTRETTAPVEAYESFTPNQPMRFQDGDLPGW
jgi:uncharacterized cupin superfamily protein